MESNSLREGPGGQQPQAIASERNRPMLPCRHHVLARAAKMRRPAIAGIAGESARSCLGNNSCAGTTQSCHRPAGHHFAAAGMQPQGQQQPFRPSFPPPRQHLLQHPPHLSPALCYLSTTTTSAQPRSPDSTSGHSLSACSRCPTTRNNHPFRERPEKLNLSGRSNVLVCIQGQARKMHECVLPVK